MQKGVVMFGSFVVDLTTRQKGLPLPGQTIIGSSFQMGRAARVPTRRWRRIVPGRKSR